MELDERTDNEWLKGLWFDQESCAELHVVSMQCPPLIEQLKLSERGFNTENVDPFVIYAGYECSTGGAIPADAWDHAEHRFDQGWLRSLERALWTGVDQDGNAFRESLAGFAPVDLTPGGGAVDLTIGLGLLEGAMAGATACWPIIHANAQLGPFFASRALLHHTGDVLRTSSGSRLVLGGGYPITGPANTAPGAGEAWIFASGGVRVTTGPKFFTPDRGALGWAVDRTVNDIEVFAEKGFAVQLACGLFAVRVKFSLE